MSQIQWECRRSGGRVVAPNLQENTECWCNNIVANVCAPTEDKIDNVKDSVYKELKHMFDKFPKCHLKILLGDFNAKVGREDIFKPTNGNT
jgi:hypothetical protein